MKAQFMTPVVTALTVDGGIDVDGNKAVYDHLIQGGIDGIVVLGSTGEFFALSMAQQKRLIELAAGHIAGRTRLLVGTSRMDPAESVELADFAMEKGADGVMIISPYYFSLTEQSVEAYYSAIAANTKARIYLYNFPDRTGYSLSPETVLRLARKHANIVGIKDTVLDMWHTSAIIRTVTPEFPDFEVYCGFDNNFAHNIISGGAGCIGGLSNLVPEVCSAWARACEADDMEKMRNMQRYIDDMMSLYNISVPFIPTIKKAMMLRGVKLQEHCTPPLLPITEAQAASLQSLLATLKIA